MSKKPVGGLGSSSRRKRNVQRILEMQEDGRTLPLTFLIRCHQCRECSHFLKRTIFVYPGKLQCAHERSQALSTEFQWSSLDVGNVFEMLQE